MPLLCLAALALLWIASGAALHKGLRLFAGGALLLAAALLHYRRSGSPRPLFALCCGALAAASGVLALEGVLWFRPGVLRGRVANYTFGGYHEERGGIYRRHPLLAREMKPSFRRALFWNGHWWRHETNGGGWRGPALDGADAVFLGDSLIYGHGVESEQAVPAQFARIRGGTAANLGQPATGPIQWLELFRAKGARLRPRSVYVCLHSNDVADALELYEAAALRRFVETPGEQPLVRPELRAQQPHGASEWWSWNVAPPLRAARLLSALRGKSDWALRAPAPGAEARADQPYVPAAGDVAGPYPAARADGPPDLRLAWEANSRALAEIRRLADGWGARVVVFDLGYPRAFSDAAEALAHELELGYVPAGRAVLRRALSGERLYLAHDGHWTAEGCAAVAAELAAAAR